MANIFLENGASGEKTALNNVDLDVVTNSELMAFAVKEEIIPPITLYYGIIKNNQPVEETATLSSLGFSDGDTVTVEARISYGIPKDEMKPANVTLHIVFKNQFIPAQNIDLSFVKNTDLLNHLIEEKILPTPDDGFQFCVIDKNNMPVLEQDTLANLGFENGDTIKIGFHVCEE
jgi:hypothetical protein